MVLPYARARYVSWRRLMEEEELAWWLLLLITLLPSLPFHQAIMRARDNAVLNRHIGGSMRGMRERQRQVCNEKQ